MSDKTRDMAEQMYSNMCDYVGRDHHKLCVEHIRFTLDSMETEIFNAKYKAKFYERILLKVKGSSETNKATKRLINLELGK